MTEENNGQLSLFDDNADYNSFVEKFKPKKTTDDCYTPENIFDAIADWVAAEYGLDRENFIRPFWPGADYKKVEYPVDCVVVDNPPFSIRTAICDFYQKRGIRFFLFSPALTLLSRRQNLCHIATGAPIVYENGAEVLTSFITNLDDSCVLRTAPELYKAIKTVNDYNVKQTKKQLPKYTYPDHVVTSAIAQRYCHYGIDYRVKKEDCTVIGELDAQREQGKQVFGYGLLLSERAAAERAAAVVWQLSEREMEIVRSLGTGGTV